jgi:CubicO group peptidase (beta-lactamase class C family)
VSTGTGRSRRHIAGAGLTLTLLCAVFAIGVHAATPAQRTAPSSSSSAAFDAVRRSAARLDRLHSLLVSHRGELIFEHYRRGMTAQRLANVKSASKSVISAMVGIAIERKLIAGLDQPVSTWFPELARDADARKRRITIEDLLTMRSGLETTSNRNYGAWVTSPNWVRFVLTRRLVSDPGTTMQYSTGSTHLLSAILSRVSGTSTWQFAQASLGRPLGITIAPWPKDPQGIYFGGNDMLFTPRQLVSLGELYLNQGRAGDRQVVPARWVAESCVPRTTSRFDAGREYGYGWWIDDVGDRTACYAWGYGGQYVMVFRDLQAVIVATSSTATGDERRSYRRELLDLIGTEVLPAVESR